MIATMQDDYAPHQLHTLITQTLWELHQWRIHSGDRCYDARFPVKAMDLIKSARKTLYKMKAA